LDHEARAVDLGNLASVLAPQKHYEISILDLAAISILVAHS
jgi:hypothetical protein